MQFQDLPGSERSDDGKHLLNYLLLDFQKCELNVINDILVTILVKTKSFSEKPRFLVSAYHDRNFPILEDPEKSSGLRFSKMFHF